MEPKDAVNDTILSFPMCLSHTNMNTVPFWLSPLQYWAGWAVSKVHWGYKLNRSRQIGNYESKPCVITHVKTPSERCNGGSNYRILIDRQNLRVLQYWEVLFRDDRELEITCGLDQLLYTTWLQSLTSVPWKTIRKPRTEFRTSNSQSKEGISWAPRLWNGTWLRQKLNHRCHYSLKMH
jgi:hypothetical protein